MELPAQKFLVMSKTFTDSKQVPMFWDECSESGRIGELLLRRPCGIRELYGLCTDMHTKTFEYSIGILLDVATNWMSIEEMQAKQLKQLDVPAGTYLVLDCCGEDEVAVAKAWQWFHEDFLPTSEYAYVGGVDYEMYPEHETDFVFCKLFIPIAKR